MKSEVARELPPRTDAVMYVELDDAERVTYDAIRAATQREIVAMLAAGGGVMAALEALLRLRQAACHTALLPTGHARRRRPPQSSSKLERLMEALAGRRRRRPPRARVLAVDLAARSDRAAPDARAGIAFVRLDGSTVDRAGVVGEFQAEDGPPVMLLSLKAGGTGLNLTAADHVFLVDPWWNPAVEDQAADRAHRIGQDKPVMVYRMVARDTVEERILELQARKRAARRCRAVRGRRRGRDHPRRPARAAVVNLRRLSACGAGRPLLCPAHAQARPRPARRVQRLERSPSGRHRRRAD